MRADIVPGGIFPDYELTDHAKTRRRLSELQGDDPMILVLARGHFCPKGHQQHIELAAFQSQIAVAYTQIVTISTDNIVDTREFRVSAAERAPDTCRSQDPVRPKRPENAEIPPRFVRSRRGGSDGCR